MTEEELKALYNELLMADDRLRVVEQQIELARRDINKTMLTLAEKVLAEKTRERG